MSTSSVLNFSSPNPVPGSVRAREEFTRRLGLPEGASWEMIGAVCREVVRLQRAQHLELPPTAGWNEIGSISQSLPGPAVAPPLTFSVSVHYPRGPSSSGRNTPRFPSWPDMPSVTGLAPRCWA